MIVGAGRVGQVHQGVWSTIERG